MRLVAQAKGIYFPAPSAAVAMAARWLQPPASQRFCILDPCCGHGAALVQPGEIWRLLVDKTARRVKVVAPAGTPGLWRCVDLETDIPLLAREEWFVDRECAGDQSP